MIVAIIIPYHDDRCVRSFTTSLKSTGWCLFSTKTTFPTHGDTILSSCHIIIGIHSLCASNVEPLTLKSPPPSLPHPISLSRWEPFNRPEHSMSLAKDDDDFMRQYVKFPATPAELTIAFLQVLLLNTISRSSLQGIDACRCSRGVIEWPLSTFRHEPK